jgi:hypothetical protein
MEGKPLFYKLLTQLIKRRNIPEIHAVHVRRNKVSNYMVSENTTGWHRNVTTF